MIGNAEGITAYKEEQHRIAARALAEQREREKQAVAQSAVRAWEAQEACASPSRLVSHSQP